MKRISYEQSYLADELKIDHLPIFDPPEEEKQLLLEIFDHANHMFTYIRNGDYLGFMNYWQERTARILLGGAPGVLKNEKNVAMYTIVGAFYAATEGGLDWSISYYICNMYLLKLDQKNTAVECFQVSGDAIKDFCTRVAAIHMKKCKTPVIAKTLHLIQQHQFEKITVYGLAAQLQINKDYLSSLFKKEMGEPLNSYIARQKIEEAKRLLLNSDKSISQISEYLAFSSQNHFQNVFKKLTGLTPHEFRKK